MQNLKNYIEQWEDNGDFSLNSFWLMFGTFLDEFYSRKDIKMIEEEPFENSKISKEIKAFVAASVDYLCNLILVKTPEWTFKKEYSLEEPFFPSELKGDIRAVMCIESPVEYKSKNIFVLANVLSRY